MKTRVVVLTALESGGVTVTVTVEPAGGSVRLVGLSPITSTCGATAVRRAIVRSAPAAHVRPGAGTLTVVCDAAAAARLRAA